MKVVVLGCGPAGLLAALAVEQAGHEPVIFSRKEKSVIPGSVYLHESVPELTSPYPDNHVQYVRLGTAEGYARKVYGDESRTTGWENYFQVYPSWNAVAAYDRLWVRFEQRIRNMDITPLDMQDIIYVADRVITTLPVWTTCLCPSKHKWKGEQYWIKTLPLPPMDAHRDVVIYNGLRHDGWYRWSVLSGVCSIESTWPGYLEEAYGEEGIISGTKATHTTCDCWPEVVRAGRWAEWRHGVLLNHAYKTVVETMKGA